MPSTKKITPPDTILAMPKESIKGKDMENTPSIKTKTKLKPYQIETGILLDLIEQREDTKTINQVRQLRQLRLQNEPSKNDPRIL